MPAMTTLQFGTLELFDGADFTDYSECLNAYFIAHNIGQVAADASKAAKREADKKKVAITISLIGKTAYSTLKDLCLPDLPADKTYDQLTQILKDHCTNLRYLKLPRSTASITLYKVKLKV